MVVLLSSGRSVWFVRNWQKEFVFLMGLRDDDFPGRHDKLIWAIVLLAFAPIGVWIFRSYRLAHWPEPKPRGGRSELVGSRKGDGGAAGLSRVTTLEDRQTPRGAFTIV